MKNIRKHARAFTAVLGGTIAFALVAGLVVSAGPGATTPVDPSDQPGTPLSELGLGSLTPEEFASLTPEQIDAITKAMNGSSGGGDAGAPAGPVLGPSSEPDGN
jgi:hypothetical protein